MSDERSFAFSGRHALVTGASRGIGFACARALARDGARVTLGGRDRGRLELAVAKLRDELALDEDALSIASFDLRNEAEIDEALATVLRERGRVDILVNNAGVAPSAPFERTDSALWSEVMATDLTAPFLCTRRVLAEMKRANWGRVVNVASTAALSGYAYVSAYCAAKHGLLGLTRALAAELVHTNITVNAVCPGFTDTDLLRESAQRIADKTGVTLDAARARLAEQNPHRTLLTPDQVAAAVRFLCTEEARAIHGVALPVAGGEI